MAYTYSQIHIQTVFAVQNRMSLIKKEWRDDLYRYITGIIQNHGHKMLAIGGVSDHIHIFFGFRPDEALSHLMMEVKRDSSLWIKQNHLVQGRFSWQVGYGAFSYGKSQISNVCRYIERQEEHHRKQTFREEYIKFLEIYGVSYTPGRIFHDVSDIASTNTAFATDVAPLAGCG